MVTTETNIKVARSLVCMLDLFDSRGYAMMDLYSRIFLGDLAYYGSIVSDKSDSVTTYISQFRDLVKESDWIDLESKKTARAFIAVVAKFAENPTEKLAQKIIAFVE